MARHRAFLLAILSGSWLACTNALDERTALGLISLLKHSRVLLPAETIKDEVSPSLRILAPFGVAVLRGR